MNRRKALLRITLAGVGIAAASGAYKCYSIVKTPDLSYAAKNKELIAALAETILPATDTPGAREAGVHDFILKMLSHCMDRKEQNTFIRGLKDIQSHCLSRYGREYPQCTPDQQEATMTGLEVNSSPPSGAVGKVKLRLLGRPFFSILKEYTVEGYCTSELGATKGLSYVYIPGSFHGCIPLEPGQKSWATN